jgi:hypothetical protein
LAIRNPSQEELESLKKGKVEPLVSKPTEAKQSTTVKQIWNADELKPKKSNTYTVKRNKYIYYDINNK